MSGKIENVGNMEKGNSEKTFVGSIGRLLTEDQLDLLHKASLEIMARTGCASMDGRRSLQKGVRTFLMATSCVFHLNSRNGL
jgi:hypothetical protein